MCRGLHCRPTPSNNITVMWSRPGEHWDQHHPITSLSYGLGHASGPQHTHTTYIYNQQNVSKVLLLSSQFIRQIPTTIFNPSIFNSTQLKVPTAPDPFIPSNKTTKQNVQRRRIRPRRLPPQQEIPRPRILQPAHQHPLPESTPYAYRINNPPPALRPMFPPI